VELSNFRSRLEEPTAYQEK